MAAHSSVLPGESHRQRGLVGYSPWGRKESDTTKQLTLAVFFFFFYCREREYVSRLEILILPSVYVFIEYGSVVCLIFFSPTLPLSP